MLSLGAAVQHSSASRPSARSGRSATWSRAGKRDSVLAAITSPDVDVNEKAPDGSTALMWATFNVDRELVRALLEGGAKADVISNYGAHGADRSDRSSTTSNSSRALLDAGADVELAEPRQPDGADARHQHRLAADRASC